MPRTLFEFRAGSLNESDLRVTRIAGQESLSQPYRFEIDFFAASEEPIALADLCGSEGLLTLQRPEGPERHVHGLLAALRMTGLLNGHPRYQATLVPKLWRLRQLRNSRIFQGMTVPDVVKKILEEDGVEQRWDLTATYPSLEYCVQHRETDFDFVSRLLEEAGIFYLFEHTQDGHTLVLLDAVASASSGAAIALPFRREAPVADGAPDGPNETEEQLFGLEKNRRLGPTKAVLKDFDFQRPGLALSADHAGSADSGGASADLEWYEYPGRFTELDVGKALAQVRLEEQLGGQEEFEGEGTGLALTPGSSLEVSEHPDPAFDRKLFLVRVEHKANQQQGSGDADVLQHDYRNRFVAIDAEGPYRPPRTSPRPLALPTTATVVGAGGQEITTDSKGRVKVQFHWDRHGQKNDQSSCWIRCSQTWAGASWGASFLPRIGQEVLVKFLDGDPDRPIIAGATYNGDNPPPLSLPDQKTQSTTRSDSSPGGGGENELHFEDQKGSEAVRLHVQKDQTVQVGNDKQQLIKASETLTVSKDRTLEVQGDQSLSVTGDDTMTVGANQTLTIAGNRSTAVQGNDDEMVGQQQSISVLKNRQLRVQGAAMELVGAAATCTVGGAFALTVGGAMAQAVGGDCRREIGGSWSEVTGINRAESVGGAVNANVAGDLSVQAQGEQSLTVEKDQNEEVGGKSNLAIQETATASMKKCVIQADKFTVTVGGKAVWSIDQSGNMTFQAAGFTLKGSGDVVLKGNKVELN